MKALSLWQPWATLIAIGAKRVETRGWPAPVWLAGQRIVIHAAKHRGELDLVDVPPFDEYLHGHDIPLGAIVATAVLARCVEMTAASIDALERCQPDERAFGSYEPGRYAWVLRDVEQLQPIDWRGGQRLFDVPAATVGHDDTGTLGQAAL